MAKIKYTKGQLRERSQIKNIEKAIGKDNWLVNTATDVLSTVGGWFGIDVNKWFGKHKNGDFSPDTINEILSTIYGEMDIKDSKMLSRVTSQLENLIGMNVSPTIKDIVSKWKRRLQDQQTQTQAKMAKRDIKRTEIAGLANELDNMSLGSYLGSTGEKAKDKIRQHVADAIEEDPEAQKRVNQVQGWKNFQIEKDKDVEERL